MINLIERLGRLVGRDEVTGTRRRLGGAHPVAARLAGWLVPNLGRRTSGAVEPLDGGARLMRRRVPSVPAATATVEIVGAAVGAGLGTEGAAVGVADDRVGPGKATRLRIARPTAGKRHGGDVGPLRNPAPPRTPLRAEYRETGEVKSSNHLYAKAAVVR